MEITKLVAYPVDLVTNMLQEKTGKTYLHLQKSLEKRGEKYFDVLREGSMQVYYEGDCTDILKPEHDNNRVLGSELRFTTAYRRKRWVSRSSADTRSCVNSAKSIFYPSTKAE